MEQPRNAKINLLKNITAPTQTIRVSHSNSKSTIDTTTIINNNSDTQDEFLIISYSFDEQMNHNILDSTMDIISTTSYSSSSAQINCIGDLI